MKMRNKSWAILVVAAVVLGGAGWWVATSRDKAAQADFTPKSMFPGLTSKVNDVASLEIATVKSLFRIEPVMLEARHASGCVAAWRVTPSSLANGVIVNGIPGGLDALRDLFAGQVRDPVRAFRIVGQGGAYHEPAYRVRWFSAAPSGGVSGR